MQRLRKGETVNGSDGLSLLWSRIARTVSIKTEAVLLLVPIIIPRSPKLNRSNWRSASDRGRLEGRYLRRSNPWDVLAPSPSTERSANAWNITLMSNISPHTVVEQYMRPKDSVSEAQRIPDKPAEKMWNTDPAVQIWRMTSHWHLTFKLVWADLETQDRGPGDSHAHENEGLASGAPQRPMKIYSRVFPCSISRTQNYLSISILVIPVSQQVWHAITDT